MRRVSLLVVFAACGGNGDGAVLSFTAPDGPVAASRIELVLANAAADARLDVRQRMRPGMLAEEDVVYYRQRSSVDAIQGIDSLDGFEVRIEPDQTVVDDETFVPFALIYDEQDALIAVGTVNDAESGAPIPVLVRPGTVASYDVTVVKIARDGDAAGIAAGQGHAVMCQGQTSAWRSGAVWKSGAGPQIRLLLPDVSAQADATDALERATDLDCDHHAADERDCDDLRSAYHPGQPELCDGLDFDCDGRAFELIEGCSALGSAMCNAQGVQLCAEAPNMPQTTTTCAPSAACGCEAQSGGNVPASCKECALNWSGDSSGMGMSSADPCAPAVGRLHTDACGTPGCTFEVVGADGEWEVEVAASALGPFSKRVTGVLTGDYFLRVNYLGSANFPIQATTIGGAYISVTRPQGTSYLQPINLALEEASLGQCLPATTSGTSSMRCTQ